jgi:hypothetical protein
VLARCPSGKIKASGQKNSLCPNLVQPKGDPGDDDKHARGNIQLSMMYEGMSLIGGYRVHLETAKPKWKNHLQQIVAEFATQNHLIK